MINERGRRPATGGCRLATGAADQPVTDSDLLGELHDALKRTKPPDFRGFRTERMKGFEPSTFAMARRRSSQLSYIRVDARF